MIRSLTFTTFLVGLAAYSGARPGQAAGGAVIRTIQENQIYPELTLTTNTGREVIAHNMSIADFVDLFEKDNQQHDVACCWVCPSPPRDDECHCCANSKNCPCTSEPPS
ncbi:hypothetical protein PLICRDRAFT_47237 [Plicaturopsis crispa FD-325 SS-3]|uniref:Unplaced genomic scaffold PLICRscaffold_25, whole genome shotgun sequence n=1 Tax=Plicaturopsis crispa FD-325 SS-3 TaxID=944288 RepID=A0A0C9T281_PLICR|nr:hypothetical protein PLICRDRAFT_47237 [Plicaturopsis crispa FD-325 SS-3]